MNSPDKVENKHAVVEGFHLGRQKRCTTHTRQRKEEVIAAATGIECQMTSRQEGMQVKTICRLDALDAR